jgi:hypothetical protein
MTRAALRLVCVLLALAAWGCPMPPPPLPSSTVPGVYHARLPAADASTRLVTLWLQPGGAATLETVYVGGQGRMPVQNGTWSASGDEVTVVIEGESEPLVFGIQPDRLVPKRWDRKLYGENGLPLTRRSTYKQE